MLFSNAIFLKKATAPKAIPRLKPSIPFLLQAPNTVPEAQPPRNYFNVSSVLRTEAAPFNAAAAAERMGLLI